MMTFCLFLLPAGLFLPRVGPGISAGVLFYLNIQIAQSQASAATDAGLANGSDAPTNLHSRRTSKTSLRNVFSTTQRAAVRQAHRPFAARKIIAEII